MLKNNEVTLAPPPIEERKSEVWKNFAQLVDKDGSTVAGYVACVKCKTLYSHTSANGTRTLLAHMKTCGTTGTTATAKANTNSTKNDVLWKKAGFNSHDDKKVNISSADKKELNEKVLL